MNKISIFLQKYVGYIAIISFGLLFVYSLGMATPTASFSLEDSVKDFYKDIMPYNNAILTLSIIGLLFSAFYMVLRNNVRPVYYVSNFFSLIFSIVFMIVSSVFTFVGVSFYQNKFSSLVNSPDFEKINETIVSRNGTVNKNTSVFVLGYLIAVLLIIVALLYVIVLIKKINDRRIYENNKKNGISNPVTYRPIKEKKENEVVSDSVVLESNIQSETVGEQKDGE